MGFEDEPVEHIKVAITTFAFKNELIINLLKERGEIIKNEDWEKMMEIDNRINEIKTNHLSDLMTPCSVFMTFETEEGIARALNLNDTIEAQPEYKSLMLWLGKY